MPSIIDIFDVCNPNHVKAFMVMQYTGAWPSWFKMQFDWGSLEFPGGWKNILEGNMALVYAEKLLGYETMREIRDQAFKVMDGPGL